MPWRASSVMEERLRFVARLLAGEGGGRLPSRGTKVLANPRGYPGERTAFDPRLVIEI